jgi:hypothetical protein
MQKLLKLVQAFHANRPLKPNTKLFWQVFILPLLFWIVVLLIGGVLLKIVLLAGVGVVIFMYFLAKNSE